MGHIQAYELVVSEARKCCSPRPKIIAKKLGISKEVVMKILLTEGLWKSRQSEIISKYLREGKSIREIADILHVTEKAIWPYVPYGDSYEESLCKTS